jgi:hypothetical protein
MTRPVSAARRRAVHRHGARVSRCALLCFSLLLATASSGCVTSASLSQANSFVPQFDCPTAKLGNATGGYRLEGCGKIAFYHCSELRYSGQQRGRRLYEEQTVGNRPAVFWVPQGPLQGQAFRPTREGVDQSTTPRQCTFDSERPMSETELAAERERVTPSEAELAAMRGADQAKLGGRAKFQNGQLEVLGTSVESEYLLLSLRSKQALELNSECRMTGIVDATPLTIKAVRQRSAHELQLLVHANDLRGLETSTRFFGSVCGVRFDLDERARRDLAKYALTLSRS